MASFQRYTTKEGVRWMYKYYGALNPLTGKKKQSTKRGFKTKKEAQLDAARTEQEIESGTFVEEDKTITFEQVYNQWFETNSPSFKPSTRKAVRLKFKRILAAFGKLKIREINRAYCQEVINKWAKELKATDNFKMYANQIFNYALSMDIILTNPMTGVIIPKKNEEFIVNENEDKRNYWDKTEIKKFIEVVKTECTLRDQVLFHLFVYTGARKGEILALRWGDIDFENKVMTFNKTLFFDDKSFSTLTSKTASSRRLISIDDTTLKLLRKLEIEQKKERLQSILVNNSDMVFMKSDHTPIRLAYPNDKLNEIIKKGNLHPITVHGLRHTHASLLFEAGASIKEVQERLGHSDIKMTMNIYTHVTKTVKEKTASRFEKFMEG